MYSQKVPKLWNETIQSHRAQVNDAILDAAAALVFSQGLRGVTMAQIAERAGIGRATLYKYFPDAETILRAWHARQIGRHIAQLTQVRDEEGTAPERLHAMLTTYAHIARQSGNHDRELVTFLHPDAELVHARDQLRDLVRQLIAEGAAAGEVRADIAPAELANYCLHALTGAADVADDAALGRLVALTLAGLRPGAPAG